MSPPPLPHGKERRGRRRRPTACRTAASSGVTNASFASAGTDGGTLAVTLTSAVNARYGAAVSQGLGDPAGHALAGDGDGDATVGAPYGEIDRSGRVILPGAQAVEADLLEGLS